MICMETAISTCRTKKKKALKCDRSTDCLYSTGALIFNTRMSFIIACSFLNYWLGVVGEAAETRNKNHGALLTQTVLYWNIVRIVLQNLRRSISRLARNSATAVRLSRKWENLLTALLWNSSWIIGDPAANPLVVHLWISTQSLWINCCKSLSMKKALTGLFFLNAALCSRRRGLSRSIEECALRCILIEDLMDLFTYLLIISSLLHTHEHACAAKKTVLFPVHAFSGWRSASKEVQLRDGSRVTGNSTSLWTISSGGFQWLQAWNLQHAWRDGKKSLTCFTSEALIWVFFHIEGLFLVIKEVFRL